MDRIHRSYHSPIWHHPWAPSCTKAPEHRTRAPPNDWAVGSLEGSCIAAQDQRGLAQRPRPSISRKAGATGPRLMSIAKKLLEINPQAAEAPSLTLPRLPLLGGRTSARAGWVTWEVKSHDRMPLHLCLSQSCWAKIRDTELLTMSKVL